MGSDYLTIVLLLFVPSVYAVAIVNTPVGEIHGITSQVTVDGTTHNVNKYLGIPFAQPPVGDLRFHKPVPLTQLNSPHNASKFGHICPQMDVYPVDWEQSEDCLFLNVFVPEQAADMPSGHAVMVWIYGGSFILGSANDYDGGYTAAYGNVIYVSMNYRVGPLGFLSTMDEHCRGNAGLWDQRVALQWVHENIGAFGGDTSRVTVYGESAGAISTTLQALYPDNMGLFQRVISQSGVGSVGFIHSTRNTLPVVRGIAEAVGCKDTAESKVMLDCMRRVRWEDFMKAVSDLVNSDPNNLDYMIYDPVVDGELIKTDPKLINEHALEGRKQAEVEFYQSLDVINGFNHYEGGISMNYFAGSDMNQFQPTSDDMLELIKVSNKLYYERDFHENVNKLIAHEYTNWTDPYNYATIRVQYAEIHGDVGFAVPAVVTSRVHSAGAMSNSYMYRFMPIPTHQWDTTPTWLPGADHGDDIEFVMGIEQRAGVQDWEIQLSLTMLTYWTNFAKTGNPNTPNTRGPTWHAYSVESQDYMELDSGLGDHSSKQFLLAGKTHFWHDVIPAIVSQMDQSGNHVNGPCNPTETSSAPGIATNGVFLLLALVSATLF